MKKSLAIMLALIMALALVPTVAFAENEGAEGAASGAEPAANQPVAVSNLAGLQTALNNAANAGSGIDTTIELTADITLGENDTWKPVRVSADAGVVTLNGNGNTITGLNAPLFKGGFGGKSGIVIKDLTLENVALNNLDANSEYANKGFGAFIGWVDSMPTISLNNCHVKGGTINSQGEARVGGLIGWTSGYNQKNNGPVDTYVTLDGCSVSGLTINGEKSVGGLIGHAGANSATYHDIKNCAVTGCTLTSSSSSWCVGNLIGTANVGQVTVDQATVDNTNGNTRTQSNATGSAIENGLVGRASLGDTGILIVPGKVYAGGDSVALVKTSDGTIKSQHTTISDAVAAAGEGDTVMMLKDVTLTDAESITVEAMKDFTLDLNGFTISQEKKQTSGHSLLTNNGTLVIKDSSAAGTGKITYEDTGSGSGTSYTSNTITNKGTLTLESGTIENTCSTNTPHNGLPYAIDNQSGSSAATLIINGGTVDCKAYSAIRLFCNSTTNTNSATISGGTIRGCVEYQQPIGEKDKALGSLTITDGRFESNAANMKRSLYIFSYRSERDCSGMSCSISGGTFERLVEVNGYAKGFNGGNEFITGGTYNNGQYKNNTFDNNPSKHVKDTHIAKRTGNALENYVYTVIPRKNLTDGVYMADPTGALASGYYVSGRTDTTWTVSYNNSSSGHDHYYPTATPVPPIIVNPPKTGDMTIWQSILHFLGII